MTTKPNIGPHANTAHNRMTFDMAFTHIYANPTTPYATTGDGTPFTARAALTTRGVHKGERVIIFRSNGQERARAYECCWGHGTNCNRTHIACYSEAV